MKTKILATVIACMAVLTASTQTVDLKRFFEINDYFIRTEQRLTTDFNLEKYQGEEYLAGWQAVNYKFTGVQKDETVPNTPLDTLTAFSSFTDMYGREHWRDDNSKNILSAVNRYIKYSAVRSTFVTGPTLSRGGVYAVRTYIDFLEFDKRDTITIKDDPTLRISCNTVVKRGSDVNVMAFYNTGYPFDINSLTGNEYAKVTVYKHITDSTAEEMSTQQFQLHLKDEAHPLVAAIDTLDLRIQKPEPGAYTMRFESNWDAVKNRDLPISVQDTLRATVSLDKQTYNLSTDKKARLNLTMDYGYPHISAMKPDTIPTIRISAVIKESAQHGDTIFCDSLKMANDSLQTKDLLYKGDWELDLTQIDQSKLNGTSAEKQLHVTISFNGQKQYAAVLPVSIMSNATGITHISASGQNEEAVYTLNGVRVNPKHRLPAGVYIRNGKKAVVK